MSEKLLQIQGLKTHFKTESGIAEAVDGVNLDIFAGEVLGLVGESGAGKSVTALSIMRLIPNPPGEIVAGSILFRGQDLLKLSWQEMRKIRGKEISMIFQEPMTSLNPVFTIGMQLSEVVLEHEGCSKQEAFDRGVEMLKMVGIPEPALRMITDLMGYCAHNVPQWNTISISGYHIREAGSTAAQELAFTMANGLEYVRRGIAAGMEVDAFAPRLSFFFDSHLDFFEEIAKFRAARRIWARKMRDEFGARNENS